MNIIRILNVKYLNDQIKFYSIINIVNIAKIVP